MRRPLLLLVVLSCKFGDALDSYCRESAQCECDGGRCCVRAPFACDTGAPCCGGATCVSGTCVANGGGGGGGVAGGGVAGGGVAGGGVAGGGVAGGGAAGGAAGGMAGGLPDASFPGVALPYCAPTAGAGTVANTQGCCRDYECDSGMCLGYPVGVMGGRRCTTSTIGAPLGDECGDENDCSGNLACDLRFDGGRCVNTFSGVLDGTCRTGTRQPGGEQGCTFVEPDGGLATYSCWLPGTPLTSMGQGPCCYDRHGDGGVASCLVTGRCSCNDAGACQNDVVPYVCPF